jgi:hypothetical protein
VKTTSTTPNDTWIKARIRVALPGGSWSQWVAPERAADLPPFEQAEVEVTLHTDDGYVSPRFEPVEIDYQ